MMGIACLLRATSCPIFTLPLPEHWLTSRADSTQYSAKQMRVKKRNPIDTGLFPCTACMCDSTACCEGEASYSRGERISDKAEQRTRMTLDTLHMLGAGTSGTAHVRGPG